MDQVMTPSMGSVKCSEPNAPYTDRAERKLGVTAWYFTRLFSLAAGWLASVSSVSGENWRTNRHNG